MAIKEFVIEEVEIDEDLDEFLAEKEPSRQEEKSNDANESMYL